MTNAHFPAVAPKCNQTRRLYIPKEKREYCASPVSSSRSFFSSLIVVIILALPQCICQATPDHIHQAEPHRHPAHDSPSPPLLHKRLPPAARQKQVQARPRGANPGTVGLETLQIRIAGEEKHGREQHRKELKRAHVLRGNERGEKSRRKRVFWWLEETDISMRKLALQHWFGRSVDVAWMAASWRHIPPQARKRCTSVCFVFSAVVELSVMVSSKSLRVGSVGGRPKSVEYLSALEKAGE